MARNRPSFGPLIVFSMALVLAMQFAFAAVQGSNGIFRRVQIDAEIVALTAERDALRTDVAHMTNLTRRLSDEYLDLDLLDERTRDMLGSLRADEIMIR